MKEDDYVTLQKFNSIESTKGVVAILKENRLDYQIEDASPPVDITFSGNTLQNEFRVKIRQTDFEKANKILEDQAEQLIDEFSEEHYLYEFSDEELMEIIEKPDEWSKEDHLLSQRILKDSGKEISKEKVEEFRTNRINELRRPEKGHRGWLIFGFISAILGGLIGVFIGWYHWTSKKTDPTGQNFYVYDLQTRKTGQMIFWVGLAFFIFTLINSFYDFHF